MKRSLAALAVTALTAAGTLLVPAPRPATAAPPPASSTCVGEATVIPPDPSTDTFTEFRFRRCGVADLDQHRAGLPANGDMYCGPTSTANWMLYLADRGAAGVRPGPGQAGNDAVTQMLIADLGTTMGTSATTGTSGQQILDGARSWLVGTYGVLTDSYFTIHADWGFDTTAGGAVDRWRPTGRELTSLSVHGSLVMSSLGYYGPAMPGSGYDVVRTGGHVQTIVSGRPAGAGAPDRAYIIGVHDPASSEDPVDLNRQSAWTTDLLELDPSALKVGPDAKGVGDRRTEHLDKLSGSFYTDGYLEGALLITPTVGLFPDPVLHDHAELRRSLGLPGGPPRSTTISTAPNVTDVMLDPRGSDRIELRDDGRIVRIDDLDGSTTVVGTVPGATALAIDDQLRTAVIDGDGNITVLDAHGNPAAGVGVPGAAGLAFSPRLGAFVTYDAAAGELVTLDEVVEGHLQARRIGLGALAPPVGATIAVDTRSGAVGLLAPRTNRLLRLDVGDARITTSRVVTLGTGAPLDGLVADAGGGWYSTRDGAVVAFDADGNERPDNPFAGQRSGPDFEILQPMDVGTEPVGPDIDPRTAPHGDDQVLLSQASATEEVGDRHDVVVASGADRLLSYTIDGANPTAGTVRTDAAGRAVVSWTGSAVGIDELFVGGTGVEVEWVPAPTYATATALTSTPNPSVGGRPITLDARVTAPDGVGNPTGTVRFVDDGRPLGSGPVGGDGRAAITTTAIPGGTHRIVAEYLPTPGSRFLPSATQMTLHVDCYVLDVLCIVRVLLGRPHG